MTEIGRICNEIKTAKMQFNTNLIGATHPHTQAGLVGFPPNAAADNAPDLSLGRVVRSLAERVGERESLAAG